jgi:prepilin-type N-terminal cleavage/methylation domain-containing protein
MKTKMIQANSVLRRQSGFTLAEVVVAMFLAGVMITSLYAGICTGFSIVRTARENQRATQILAERMEIIRLVKWDNVAHPFIPGSFTAPFDVNATNSLSGGFEYTGTVTITNAPVPESYSNNLRMIQIDLTWTSGNASHTRQMTTFASKFGLQNYIY